MRILVVLLVAFTFLGTGCSSNKKKSKRSKKVAAAGQLRDHDYKIHQPLETEIMIMIDSRGRAKQIPNEWDVDTSAHKPYRSSRSVASTKKYKKSKKKYKKSKKKKKKRATSKKKRRSRR